MNTTAELKSIKEDIEKLLKKIDGYESTNKPTTNPTAGDILPELCFKRRIFRPKLL